MSLANKVVSIEVSGEIGLLLVDSPPVNALSHAVREGLLAGVADLNADPAVRVIVLACRGRTFCAGADITEFGKPKRDPSLQQAIAGLEASAKPLVAALHGTALGGGLEVALGCHFRVAVPTARMGLPEISLGIIPGAGGTQRLPRIIGPEKALELILSGKTITAAEALALGVIDAVLEGEPLEVGQAFARRILAEGLAATPVRERQDKIAATRLDPAAFEALAEKLTRGRGREAGPAAAVASVRRSFTQPIDDALAADSEVNAELIAGGQSRALRHLFFAEREAAKVSGLPAGVAPRPVARAAVIGAGTMGGGIAMSFAGAGVPVTLIDATQDALDRGLDRLAGNYAASVKRGSLSQAEMDKRMGLISGAVERSAAADCDLVVEAVFEDEALKKEIFAELERVCRPGTILASNTSALDVDAIAAALQRPEDFVGMHFFAPANVMKLLEVVRAADSGPEAIVTAMAVGRKIGKVPVVSGNCDGFIGNRMVAKRSAQVDLLLQKGAMPKDVDDALKAFGFPMGPLAINDMSGLDIGWSIRKRRGTPFPVADAICERGWFGQKTGQGYYRYAAGDRTPQPNPEVEQLILEVAARLGVERRPIGQAEMIERMLYPLINEGARILEEGVAQRASDIDLVWINGYGWPRWTGGPMFYADEVGLARIADRLETFAADTPGDPSLKPAPLLAELAGRGSTFAEWQKQRLAA
ncbi:3-hydroxyacyl-CoA dehydrogenase NAD-binding domain-containing protein [Phenylobacterium sp. LjRoot225]|uniref:3-hydroxyacyl-CoA dehydrogenase NAD-binding domain-containing protein n=1 Tax=Phenylobacterium sp. LjRoot225 TaxID=3342285 RepID=UPI003ECED9EC